MRTFDAAFLNEVVNTPGVREWIGGGGVVDLTSLVDDMRNYTFVNERGGFIAHSQGVGVYEVHSQFLPSNDGHALTAFCRQCLHYMFTRTDCVKLVTKVNDDNRAALGLARSAGFRETFKSKAVSYQDLTVERWAGACVELDSVGDWFHEQIGGASHDHDAMHDRYVGAAVEMIRAGNHRKGVWFYNAWAKLAGYAPVVLISDNPCVIDLHDAVVEVSAGAMEVLKCR